MNNNPYTSSTCYTYHYPPLEKPDLRITTFVPLPPVTVIINPFREVWLMNNNLYISSTHYPPLEKPDLRITTFVPVSPDTIITTSLSVAEDVVIPQNHLSFITHFTVFAAATPPSGNTTPPLPPVVKPLKFTCGLPFHSTLQE
jgi:hypothetical protein